MMKIKNIKITILILFLLNSIFYSGCVTQLLKEPKPTFSKDLKLPELPKDYIKLENNVYPAWKNQSSGVVISIISDCSENQTNLKNIHSIMLESIDNPKILKENKASFSNVGKSHFRILSGLVEDKAVQIESYSFQFKKCYYLTSIAGTAEKIKSYQHDFKNFITGIAFEK